MTTPIDGDTNTLTTLARPAAALEAYLQHGDWNTAAQAAGYTNRGSAYRAAMKLLSKRVDGTIKELRTQANQRHAEKIAMLEDIIYDIEQPLADRLRAVDAHTKAEARHAALNGLDAPKQVQISAGVMDELDAAFGELRLIVTGEATEVEGPETPALEA